MAQLETAREILARLETAGFQTVLVGGCVRDLLLERPVNDYDIATAALPQQVMEQFPRCVPTGLRHGTVTVLLDGCPFEVTTFRADGDYLDGRRPEQVRFVPCLNEDLSRRDFTVNAMAMDLKGRLFDLHGGKDDLVRRRVACVGDPETRFREDALRMLRALRFAAQLDFAIEPGTLEAIGRCAELSKKLSAERVRDELEKTLCSPHPELAGQMMELGLLKTFGLEGAPDLSSLARLPAERAVRWAAFCRAVPEADLRSLRLDKKTITQCRRACEAFSPAPTALAWKHMVCDHGWEVAGLVAALNGKERELAVLRAEDPCVSLAQLAVTGADFPDMQGKDVGRVLKTLLQHVLEHPADNEKKILLQLAESEEKP